MNSESQTRELWKEIYKNHEFAQPGAMFRGEPPNGKLFQITDEIQSQVLIGCHKRYY